MFLLKNYFWGLLVALVGMRVQEGFVLSLCWKEY